MVFACKSGTMEKKKKNKRKEEMDKKINVIFVCCPGTKLMISRLTCVTTLWTDPVHTTVGVVAHTIPGENKQRVNKDHGVNTVSIVLLKYLYSAGIYNKLNPKCTLWFNLNTRQTQLPMLVCVALKGMH